MLCIWCIILNKRQRKPTGHIMHNTETLATLGTQDRRGNTECTTQRYWQHWVQKTDGAIQNVQPRDTGNIEYTRPTGQYRMYNPETLATLGTQDRRGNTECTTQRHWQHWVHNTNGEIQNAQPRDTGNIGYAGHRTKINKKKHNTENHKDDQHEPHQKSGAKPGAREVSCSCILQDTSSFYYWYLRFRKGS
jgi:hypothetical protein